VSDLLHEIPLSDTTELAQKGLVATLRRVVEDEFADDFDAVEWELEEDALTRSQQLSDLRAEVVLYAAREAVRNAARHGRGDDPDRPLSLTISLANSEGTLELAVADGGVGCGEASPHPGHGIALHSTMTAVIGGSWQMECAAGQYTRVRLIVPTNGW